MIGIAEIEAARARIAPHVRRTPVLPAVLARAPLPVAAAVTLKLELHQVTGSFKARGAMNRLLAAPEAERGRGIVTASGGNHGLAVARAAQAAGVGATVYVPATVSPAKAEAMRAWGATVTVAGADWGHAHAAATEHARRTGAAYFHPFADPLVVAGQGTLGLEIVEQVGGVDAIVAAIGGGGLVAGLAAAIHARRPGVRVIGVEPEGSPTLKASLDAGRPVRLPAITSRVATLSCPETTPEILSLVRDHVAEIVLVGDDEMLAASRWLWREFAIAADLSGAAAVAALRRAPGLLAGAGHVVALVCGAGAEGTGP